MSTGGALDKDTIARLCADAMLAEDNASRGLGMVIEEVASSRAVLSMTVAPTMVNGHGICHGGFIFLLADSAFAFACNSHNQRTVAFNCDVTFLAPARLGARLLATATERYRVDRTGVTDVTVVDTATGITIAEFRGLSRSIPGKLVENLP